MKPFGLGYQKIDICPNFCMLYYLENAELTECMTCGHSRYKPRTDRGKTPVAYKKLRYFPITPRLQRLFMSPRTTEHMTWHQSHHACCYLFLGSQKKLRKYKKKIYKKYSKEIQKLIGARKGCQNAEKKPKLVEEVQKYKRLKFDSIFLTGESPVDKENSI